MKIAPLADVKSKINAYLDECKTSGPVVITRNGKPAGIWIYPQNDEDLENIILSRSPRFQALLGPSHRSVQDGKGLYENQFWHAVEKQQGDDTG